jgi:hypothetical protein
MTKPAGEWRGKIISEYRLKCDFCDAHISTGHRKMTIKAAEYVGWSVFEGSVLCPVCWGKGIRG